MKGLLLKEFQVWLRTRSYFLIYLLAMTVVACFTSSRISVIGLGVLIGQISAAFLADEKCGWQNYSKTLPCTPFQRVTAKYIITSFELFFGIIAYIISTFVVSNNLTHSTGISSFFPPPTPMEIYSDTCIIIAISALYLTIDLPICFKLTGSKRTVVSLIPSLIYIFTVIMGLNVFSNGTWNIIINNLRWIPAVMAVIGFVLFIASWMISVVIETNSDTDYKKKFKKIAIILVALAVTASIATAAIAVKTVGTYKVQKEESEDFGYSTLRDSEEITDDYNNLYTGFCNEFHIGMTVDECAERLVGMGYFQNQTNPEKFYSKSGKININLTTDPETGKIDSTYAYCYVVEEKDIEYATYETFENLKSNFYEGMSVDKLYLTFNQLKVFPCNISERLFFDDQLIRHYTLKFTTDEFNGSPGNEASYRIIIATDGENVIGVEDKTIHNFGKGDEKTTEIAESYLEKSKREISEFITNICNENNIKKTPREFTKKLKKYDYTESEENYDLYYSADGKVTVSLVTDSNDKLTEILAVANYGETKYIESASEEDMTAIFKEIVTGMTETSFQQKLSELDLCPDTIKESFTDNGKHRRTYEFRYRIEDYNGNGTATYTVTVDITDGKVTDITAL
ncbi:MAG: ABC-2 transporter permease [Clostridia bacterium]|nr:ABC-2 transporter permease [Clostridia bacterium]